MTNEVINPVLQSALRELFAQFLSFLSTVAIPGLITALVAVWKIYAKKSKTQNAIIESIVRGIEKSSESIGEGETAFVKKAVKAEAEVAGVEHHVNSVVKEVTAQIAEEKKDDYEKTIQNSIDPGRGGHGKP